MRQAFIAIGSNLGDRLELMREALRQLEASGSVEIVQASGLYENRAVGMADGAADFINGVVEVRTSLEPLALLELCLQTEDALGRVRGQGWVPRTIDLDLVYFEGATMNTERLQLPHPRVAERDFVVIPLLDIAADLCIGERTVADIAATLSKDGLHAYPHPLIAE